MSKVVVSLTALQRLKAPLLTILPYRGFCMQVSGSTLHQGLLQSLPGFAQVPLNVYVSKVLMEVCDQWGRHWQPA